MSHSSEKICIDKGIFLFILVPFVVSILAILGLGVRWHTDGPPLPPIATPAPPSALVVAGPQLEVPELPPAQPDSSPS